MGEGGGGGEGGGEGEGRRWPWAPTCEHDVIGDALVPAGYVPGLGLGLGFAGYVRVWIGLWDHRDDKVKVRAKD